MQFLVIFLLSITTCVFAAEANYSDVPVKNMPDEAPLPIYKPENAAKSGNGAVSEPTASSEGTTRAQYGKFKVPPVTTRIGLGGVEHNDLPNSGGGVSFNMSAEFRFHEPFSIIPRLQFSQEKAFMGLRERGGLGSTRTNLEMPEDTKFQEWTMGLNFGMELTPQDGFFHFPASPEPFLLLMPLPLHLRIVLNTPTLVC